MIPQELIADLRERINPLYANQRGTESYERKQCVEAMERLIADHNSLLAAVERCYRMLLSEPDANGAAFKAENILREAIADARGRP